MCFPDCKPFEIVDRWEVLQGLSIGIIRLPFRLCWAPNRNLDLSRIGHRCVLVREVLDNGTKEDQARYLNGKIIQSVWSEMLLSPVSRKRWKGKFPDKLPEAGEYD